jgi:5-formyltetrahydrofolate cyclo-ligase
VVGKIPNFYGAEAAAEQLAALPAWQAAHVLKANPDKAQRAVRTRALTEGKVLYMAVPASLTSYRSTCWTRST